MKRVQASVAALLAACSGAAFAQPALIVTGMGPGDIASNGQGVLGSIYESDIDQGIAYRYVRGLGVTRLGGAEVVGNLVASGDLSSAAMSSYNLSNWGNLNCFAGNTVPDLATCVLRQIPHTWNGSSWVNRGSWPRSQVTQTYTNGTFNVWVGGTRCDSTTVSPNEVSGDGSVVVGGGYLANALPNTNGTAPSGICRRFTAFSLSMATGVYTDLPKQNVNNDTRADKVNFDGSVIVGYDNGASPDPDGAGPLTAYTGRRLSIWRNGVQYLVDAYGSNDSAPVNADGTMVFSGISATQQALSLPSQTGFNLVRWQWNGTGYVPSALGRPVDWVDPTLGVVPLIRLSALHCAADGSVVLGSATYAQPGWVPSQFITRPVIWSATINEGVPIDFFTHLSTLLPPGNTTFNNMAITGVTGLSADGTALAVSLTNTNNPCLPTFAQGLVYLNGTTCEPARINFSPVSENLNGAPTSFGIILNVFASGSWPLQYQWQKETAPGVWTDLADDNCQEFSEQNFDIKGSVGSQLRLGSLSNMFYGSYRCVVTNACGTATSSVAVIAPLPTCDSIDFNNDSSSFDPQDIEAFLSVYSEGPCVPETAFCNDIDFNNDGSVFDPCDVSSFLTLYAEGPCTLCGQ